MDEFLQEKAVDTAYLIAALNFAEGSASLKRAMLVLEIEYRVAEGARAFRSLMQDVQLSRQRNGAYGGSIARNIADHDRCPA
ncbi:hypothetical protein AYJ54_37405 [Bradyrhizobium centrolobii]|uniref:Uncharacterized protein n=1 Tax=Bradyrhizobium centrolobii TaxID=1505087 RepID=A0A176Z8P2_9BRAD|nr:hypothetical protein AYJ54_37405 [Bradyrhizobium centrolobii]